MRKPGAMLGEVLAHIFKKSANSNYPFVTTTMPDHFRGKLVSHEEKCIGCKICEKDCPANAINIIKVADKQFEIVINLDKCIFCAQCVDSCPRKALDTSKEFELASLDRSTLRVRVNVAPPPAPPPAVVQATPEGQ
jgi:formate hydrogenlyase subunit 6/NADH:ubiquinone oxidoreductase subunit I